MFGSSKPTASLSSGLLARKGHARPAMRPGFVGLTPAPQHDDLGWNDMGDDMVPVDVPPVLRAREALEAELAAPEPATPEPAMPEPIAEQSQPAIEAPRPVAALPPLAVARIAREARPKDKSAFTLRLDGERHLRLRLASAVTHRSAQQLVTEALDAFLKQLPDVETLARQLPTGRAGE